MKNIICIAIITSLLSSASYAQSKYYKKKEKLPPTPVAELYTPALLTIWQSHGLMEDGIRLLLTTDGLHMHSIRNQNGKRMLYASRGAAASTAKNDGANYDMISEGKQLSRITTKLVEIPIPPPISTTDDQQKTLTYWERAKAIAKAAEGTVSTQQGMEIKNASGKLLGYISPTTYIQELIEAAEAQRIKELGIVEEEPEEESEEEDNRKRYVYFDHLGNKIANAIIIAENTLEITPFDPNAEKEEIKTSLYTAEQRSQLEYYQPQLNKDRNR